MNIDSKPGSVGFASVLFPFVYPVRLVRVDDETGDVLRDPRTGLAVLCRPGEPGEFVGKIVKGHPSRSFDGYVNARATQKKIVGDVLRRGDLWFRSGDLLTMDEFGWMYFVDRLGDTFRWKGENVSTMEVEAVISGCLRLQDAIAYGVEVRSFSGNMCFFPCSVQARGGAFRFSNCRRTLHRLFLRSHCSGSGQCPPNRGKSQTKKSVPPSASPSSSPDILSCVTHESGSCPPQAPNVRVLIPSSLPISRMQGGRSSHSIGRPRPQDDEQMDFLRTIPSVATLLEGKDAINNL